MYWLTVLLQIFIVLLILVFLATLFGGIWLIAKLISHQKKELQSYRTTFEIDTSDEGYNFYMGRVEKWLYHMGYSKYDDKRNGRFLKYHANMCTYNFGFNYYKKDTKLIIETWLNFYKDVESPLKGLEDQNVVWTYNSAGNEYIKILHSLFESMPEVIEQNNVATLRNNFEDISSIKNKSWKDKKFTILLIAGILLFSTILVTTPYVIKDSISPKASVEEQNEALQIIQNLYPSFTLKDSSSNIWGDESPDVDFDTYYNRLSVDLGEVGNIVYTFYGTMDTPAQSGDNVIIHMSKRNR